ncbi:hypothetical protein [Sciscionella marina]|uniref:hypothetical protein n=1 Tax=Sciscionella marina TaxID=508770 RepID=UPI0003678329|nr:hypothetical protein [Sciscionella marina]
MAVPAPIISRIVVPCSRTTVTSGSLRFFPSASASVNSALSTERNRSTRPASTTSTEAR